MCVAVAVAELRDAKGMLGSCALVPSDRIRD
jgi:hypothetical protein